MLCSYHKACVTHEANYGTVKLHTKIHLIYVLKGSLWLQCEELTVEESYIEDYRIDYRRP
jgi:hypothetical protein